MASGNCSAYTVLANFFLWKYLQFLNFYFSSGFNQFYSFFCATNHLGKDPFKDFFRNLKIMSAIHSTKNSGLSFQNFPVPKGKVFSSDWSGHVKMAGLPFNYFVCYSSTISSKQTFLTLQSNKEMIITVL